MRVLVIGSGVIGVTTAHFLRCRGCEVTVIDREEGPGRETSFANGGLLTPSMSHPWNAPGCWRVLLASLGRTDAAFQLHLRVLPALARWGVSFLRHSRRDAYERNVLTNLRLSLYSLEVMRSLRQQMKLEYGRTAQGSLNVFRDRTSLDRASEIASRRLPEGLSFRRLSREETVAVEPALEPIARQLAGALHYLTDETGDAYRFCVALADYARQQGVEFRFGIEVSSLETRAGRVRAAVSREERFVADRYIVAAGSYSTPLLRSAGIQLPVQPAKGYSVTFESDRAQAGPALRVPVIDDQLHAGVVPLEGVIRVAGTAEFSGYDRTMNPERIRNLQVLLKSILPQSQLDLASAKPWCGLRAMSADGVPVIGPTPLSNVFVNTGHGHLGWTMAAGSAQMLADLMCGDFPAIDITPFSLTRFQ